MAGPLVRMTAASRRLLALTINMSLSKTAVGADNLRVDPAPMPAHQESMGAGDLSLSAARLIGQHARKHLFRPWMRYRYR